MPLAHDALLQALAAKDFSALERAASQIIVGDPNLPLPWRALGIAQIQQGKPAQAVESLERALALGSDGAELRFELAGALEQLDRWDDAVNQLQRAVAQNPQFGEAQINLAALLEKLDRTEESLACARRAVTLCPEHPMAHYNLASVLQSLGRIEEAIVAYSASIKLDENFALAYTNRGCCRLLQPDYASGWADYEWRSRSGRVQIANYSQPRWNGKPLSQGTLLVHGEQGIGDEILFASCLPEVVPLVNKCVLSCDPRLAKLMARSFPAITIFGHSRSASNQPPQLPWAVHAQIPAGSLPMYLRPTAASFPTRPRFLVADPTRRRWWRNRFEHLGPGLKIGISWRGGGTWEERRKRTTALAQWGAMLNIPGAHFINLQYGNCSQDLAAARQQYGVVVHQFEEGDPLGELDEFAAKTAALDLVISIGNATVHLAAALGVPTWCLVPKVPQWRWGLSGETTPWYPSVRLFRQSEHGNWGSVLESIGQQLRKLVAPGEQGASVTSPLPQTEPRLIKLDKVVSSDAKHSSQSHPCPKLPSKQELIQQATNLFNENRFEEAGKLAEQILAADPNSPFALRVLGVVARKRQQMDRALELLNRALELAPRNAVLHFEKGVTFTEMSRQRDAYECFLRTVEFNPAFQPALVNISAILEQQERFEEALPWAQQAAQLKADCPLAHYNLANSLRECGRVEQAIRHYERAVELKPDYTKAKWNLGICHLLLGNFAQGWSLFELRDSAEEVKLDKYSQPCWDGSPLAGKTVVVHAEQGIGDEVLFASCFPDIIAQAGKVIVSCEPRLTKLFARSFPQATIQGWTRRKDWQPMPLSEPVDYHVPAGSLPFFFRSKLESFPQRETFLCADPDVVNWWKIRFAELGPGLKVGLSWRAGGKANEGRKRTISLLDWREILSTPGVDFINLQYGDVTEDVAEVERELGVPIHDWEQGDPLVDMDSYAAKIAALDLVISVGNAAVHLAGAVGTTAWTLLPRVPSWRWMVTGDVSPWYSSVRLFRQPQRNQWRPVLDQISTHLQEVAGDLVRGTPRDEVARRIRSVLPKNERPETSPIEKTSAPTDQWFDPQQLGCRQPLNVIATLQEQAEKALSEGNSTEAQRLYREILLITPRHMKAHVGLGLIAQEHGQFDAAVRSLQRALSIFEPHPLHQFQLARALLHAGRAEEALRHANRAVALDPRSPPAQLSIGLALQAVGQPAKAVPVLKRVLQILPGDAEITAALGRSLAATGNLEKALQMLRAAVLEMPTQSPDQLHLQLALGELLFDDQCYAEAECCFRRAIELKTLSGQAHYQLARLLEQQQRADEAIAADREATRLLPQFLPAYLHLASLLRAAGNSSEAESVYRDALQLQPDSVDIHILLGSTLAERSCFEDAIAKYDKALRIQSDNAHAHIHRANCLLRVGRFADGWDEYEWRWRDKSWRGPLNLSLPHWDGSALEGKSILIHGEQSIGDEILFGTCYPDVIRQAKQTIIVCESRLQQLLRRSFPQAVIFGLTPGSEHQWRLPPQLSVDVQCAAGSVPRFLRRTEAAFPLVCHSLLADSAKVTAWRERFAALGTAKKIGIAWGSGEIADQQQLASPPLSQWLPLLSAPGVEWINLESRHDSGEAVDFLKQRGVRISGGDDTNSRFDLDGLAAKIAALDLVIAVDSVAAHLAGALGIPTWVLLAEPSHWCWMTDRTDSPWYGSVRLFRQSRPHGWSELFWQLRAELLKPILRLDEESKMGDALRPHWSLLPSRRKQSHSVD